MGTDEKDLRDRLFVRDYDTLAAVCQRNYKAEGELSYSEIENGIVLPFKKSKDGKKLGGVCDEKFNFIAGSAMKRFRIPNTHYYGVINGGYTVPSSEIIYSDETVVYGGSIAIGFYESLFVFFPAFNWWNVAHPDSDSKIVLISFNAPFSINTSLKKTIIDYFELINIKEDRLIFCDKPTKFKKIIVPETSMCLWHDFYKEYVMFFEFIRNQVEPAPYKKIYLTRREYDKRGNAHDYINEEYFENYYRKKGYEIIAPEKYSLKEQVAIYSGAEEIVSVLGSATVSSWTFARPHTKVVCLNRIDDTRDWNFITLSLIAQMKELDYYFVDISYNFLQQSLDFGACLFGPTEYWKEYVKKTFGDDIIVDREAILKEFSYQYIKNWTQLSMYPNWYRFKKNIDNFDILNDMCRVVLGIDLDKSNYDVGPTKIELNRKVAELSTALNKANAELSNDARLEKLSAIERQLGVVADAVLNAQLSTIEREKLIEQNKSLSARTETQNNYIDYTNNNLEKLQENNQRLLELCRFITDKKDELAKANESMAVEAAKKDSTIKELNTSLANAEKTISKLQEDFGNLQKETTERIALKDQAIEELNVDLANSEKTVSELKNDISTLQTEKENIIAQKDSDIEKFNAELAASQKKISDLQTDVDALKDGIANMENSHSWKLTKPLRAIKRLFVKK